MYLNLCALAMVRALVMCPPLAAHTDSDATDVSGPQMPHNYTDCDGHFGSWMDGRSYLWMADTPQHPSLACMSGVKYCELNVRTHAA